MLERKLTLLLVGLAITTMFSACWTQAHILVVGVSFSVGLLSLYIFVRLAKQKSEIKNEDAGLGLPERMQEITLSLTNAYQAQLDELKVDFAQVRSLLGDAIIELQNSFNGLNNTTQEQASLW